MQLMLFIVGRVNAFEYKINAFENACVGAFYMMHSTRVRRSNGISPFKL